MHAAECQQAVAHGGRDDLILLAIEDITGRREGESAIRQGEQRLKDLIKALPGAVYTTDAAGLITSYNPAAVEIWGREPELGKEEWCGSWRMQWPDGTPLPHDECPMAIALKGGRQIRGAEAVAERPDGVRVPLLVYPTPLFDASGALTGAVNMLVDITERKRAEECRGAARRHCRILGRRDHQQGPRRNYHQLEPGCGTTVRLWRRRDRRQIDHDPDPAGPAGRRNWYP